MNEILQGDAVEVLGGMGPDAFDLTVTSPPYDKLRDYQGYAIDLHALGEQLFRVTKEGGVCAVVINDQTVNRAKTLTSFSLAVDWCKGIGWRLFECCIYHRHGKPGDFWRRRFRVDHEYIMIFHKGREPAAFRKDHLMVPCKTTGIVKRMTSRDADGSTRAGTAAIPPTKCRGTVWRYVKTSGQEGNRLKLKHPATFPDALARDLILAFSNEGDAVLDPMMGSGTALVVAAEEGRRWLGIDISPEYCELAKERIAECQPSLFGGGA